MPGFLSFLWPGAETELVANVPENLPAGRPAELALRSAGRSGSATAIDWATVWGTVAAVWVVGALVNLVWLAGGLVGAWRVARSARPIGNARILRATEQAATWLGVKRPVRWLSVSTDAMPVTWGVWRPCVVLPDAACTWSDERLDAVITHELSHVVRRDALSHLIAQVTAAVWWWHPLMWMAVRSARLERERACDDLVLTKGARASDYATDLMTFVDALKPSSLHSPTTLAMARHSQLEGRVMAILDSGMNRRGVSQSGVLAAMLVMVLALPLSAMGTVPVQEPQTPVRIGGTVKPPTKIKDVRPVYPDAARAEGVEGIVIVEARIGTDGSVLEVKVIRSIPALDDAAVEAVRQWEFQPTLLNGNPVEVMMTATVNFSLKGGGALQEPLPQSRGIRGGTVETSQPRDPVTWSPGDPPIRIGGEIKEPKKIVDVKPVYPAIARQAKLAGIVILEILINEDGFVDDVKVLRPVALLDQAAVDAVMQWEYTPTLLNGVPVPVIMTVTVSFTPQGS